MALEHDLMEFWKNKIMPRFDERALNFYVTLTTGEVVRFVNLDNAATTTPFKRVIDDLADDLISYGSVHRGAGEKSEISTGNYEKTRIFIRDFFNAPPSDYVIYTSNTTTGMNQLAYFFSHIKGKVIVSDIEHSSSSLPFVHWEGQRLSTERVSLEDAEAGNTSAVNQLEWDRGNKKVITYETNTDFAFDLKGIERILQVQCSKKEKDEEDRIKLLVITGASNVTGYKPPIREISALAHRYNARVALDACQLLQHEMVDMQKYGIDYLVFSGHKMYSLTGSGAIVGDRRVFDAFPPMNIGGGNFKYKTKKGEVIRYKINEAHDAGTPNFIGARALLSSLKELAEIGFERLKWYEDTITTHAFEQLKSMPDVEIYTRENVNGEYDRSVIPFNIRGMPHFLTSSILHHEYGIGTRAGSFCTYELIRRINRISNAEDQKIAEEVKKGITAKIPGIVRASFSIYNNMEDVKRFTTAIREISEKSLEYYKERYIMNPVTGNWVPK